MFFFFFIVNTISVSKDDSSLIAPQPTFENDCGLKLPKFSTLRRKQAEEQDQPTQLNHSGEYDICDDDELLFNLEKDKFDFAPYVSSIQLFKGTHNRRPIALQHGVTPVNLDKLSMVCR